MQTKQQDLDFALGDAILDGDVSAARKALENGANINSLCCVSGSQACELTPLYWAVSFQLYECAEMLCQYCPDANLGEDLPIVCACQAGDIRMLKILLLSGITIDVEADNNLALYEALRSGCLDIVRLLVSHGADMREQERPILGAAVECLVDSELEDLGHAALMYAIESGSRADIRSSSALRSATGHRCYDDLIFLMILLGGDPLSLKCRALFDVAEAGNGYMTQAMLAYVGTKISNKNKGLVLKALGDAKRRKAQERKK